MRVIHLPSPTGNHGYSMAVAERKAGIESSSLIIGENKYRFKSDMYWNPRSGLYRYKDLYKFFQQVNGKYDVYHFNNSKTILDFPKRNIDLFDLRHYRGGVFFTFNGSDLRQPVSKKINPYTPFTEGEYENDLHFNNRKKLNRLNKIFKYADFCFALNPDLLRFIPKGKGIFLPYVKFIWYDLDRIPAKTKLNDVFRIVHAPTNRTIKGTGYIINAVKKLEEKYSIELHLVENMNHSDALALYRSADLVIDQLRIGWYGGLAIEAMKMGIPVAAYLNEADMQFIPADMSSAVRESVIQMNPDTIKEKLREIIEDRSLLKKYANNAYDYVCEFHNPDKLIKTVISKYEKFAL